MTSEKKLKKKPKSSKKKETKGMMSVNKNYKLKLVVVIFRY